MAQGFKVGTHMSPHILDRRERMLVNNTYIGESDFVQRFKRILTAADQTEKDGFGGVSLFEYMLAIAYVTYIDENVDYMVIETGLGGKFDATNSISREDKLAIITRIGLDHTSILGKTYTAIAKQKAGIIGMNNCVITITQPERVLTVFKAAVAEKNGTLQVINTSDIQHINTTSEVTSFHYLGKPYELGLLGTHQVENACIALCALKTLSQRDGFVIQEEAVKNALKTASLPARLEKRSYVGTPIFLDGAHNPQKMRALIKSLKAILPNQKIHFLVGFKAGKECEEILQCIIPLAKHITVTRFSRPISGHILSVEPTQFVSFFEKMKFSNYTLVEDAQRALDSAAKGELLVITGSLYLASEIRPFLTEYQPITDPDQTQISRSQTL